MTGVLNVGVQRGELAIAGAVMASVLRMVWVEVGHGEARRSKAKPRSPV
jgi:hypothetical protein